MMSGLGYRPLALLLLVLHLGACSSWRPTTVPPRQFIEEERPSRVRITTLDGNQVVLEVPTIVNDSIVFTTVEVVARDGFIGRGGETGRQSIALAVVRAIEERRSNWGFIVAIPVIVVGVSALVIVLLGGLDFS